MGAKSKYFVIAFSILVVMAAATLLAFAEQPDAEWRITPSLSLDKVHLIVRQTNSHGSWRNGSDVPLDKFRGFSLSMLASPGPAKFEYVGDAGRLICEGRFWMGTGSGSYTFVADHAFVSALQQMGYDTPDDAQLFSMLMMDINRVFAREIRDSGLRASSQDLVGLKIHGVTLDYIHAARQAGYTNFTAEDYSQLRIHGVDTTFLRDLKDAGYNLLAGDIAQLRIHGVDSRYIRDLKSYGLKPDASDLTQMRIHGVEPRFVQEAHRLGYDFTADELAQLRIHGVDEAYLRRLKDSGMRNLNADQIAQLRIHGVD